MRRLLLFQLDKRLNFDFDELLSVNIKEKMLATTLLGTDSTLLSSLPHRKQTSEIPFLDLFFSFTLIHDSIARLQFEGLAAA